MGAMVIFLGFKCEVLNKDVSLQDDAKDTLSSQSESTVAFALAWVIISTFELNENSFCQYHCTRWVAKAQLFLFWVLFAVSTCVEGEELLENAKEAEDTEAPMAKQYIDFFVDSPVPLPTPPPPGQSPM